MQPAYQGIDSVYKSKADNKDIRDLLERLVPKAKAQMVDFSKQFKGNTEQETCKKIFDYIRNNFTYVADGEEQIIKLPSALLKKKVGDCKSYSLFTSGILENLGIPYHFVYASYNENPIPGHVYVTTNNGCIIDAVYGIFNQEKKPIYKYKKNMNVRYMAGTCSDCNTNQGIGETWWQRQQRLAKAQLDAARKAIKDAAEDLGQGVRTVGLAGPRNFILLLIRQNYDGLASKLQAMDTTNFSNKWKEFGGDRTILTNNIKEGASKREKKLGLLPRIKKLLGNRINGIGQTEIPNELKALIIAAFTAAGTALGAKTTAAAGAATGGSATAGGGATGASIGAAAGGLFVSLLPTIISLFKRVPDTASTNITDPDTDTNTDTNTDNNNTGGGGGGTTPSGSGMNLNVILPIALVAGAGIYLATRKK